MHRPGRAAATTLALLGLTVSACSSSTRSSDVSASSTSPESTASTTSSPADVAQAVRTQVLAFVPTYVRMIDDLYLDPSRPLDDIYQVAVAPDATAEATAIGKFRA